LWKCFALCGSRKRPPEVTKGAEFLMLGGCEVSRRLHPMETTRGWRCPFPAWGCGCAEKGPRMRGGRVACSSLGCGYRGVEDALHPWGTTPGWRCPFPAWGCVCAAEKGPRFRGGRVLCSSHECPAQRAVTGSGGLSGAECPWGGALCQRGGQCGRSRGRCGIRRAGCPRDSRERPSGGPTRRWGLAGIRQPLLP
jgi:hypothetical protein